MHLTLDVQQQYLAKGMPDETYFEQWVRAALSHQEQAAAEVSIRLVDRPESQELNLQYRGKDKPTNVLSFPAPSYPGMPNTHLGDLIICVPVVQDEARQQQKTLSAHFAHMTIHGILHLLGYDHLTDEQAKQMENLEISLLETLGFGNPYEDTA